MTGDEMSDNETWSSGACPTCNAPSSRIVAHGDGVWCNACGVWCNACGTEFANFDHDKRVIEVDAQTYERFEARRNETKNAHVPEMDQSTFLSALLDTQQAVREGYYDDE